ncbi:MAG: Fe-S cluster assembly sulfur transfer protein SufU [Fimbriimonadaceae bacterium]
MMRELYQEMILDHNKNPRNRRTIENTHHHAEGLNPLCGDQVEVYLTIEDDIIQDISFVGHGCAISTASASLMTEALKGKPITEAKAIFEEFHNMLMDAGHVEFSDDLEALEVLGGVKAYPMRVKCASLAWHTFSAALEGKEVASTE